MPHEQCPGHDDQATGERALRTHKRRADLDSRLGDALRASGINAADALAVQALYATAGQSGSTGSSLPCEPSRHGSERMRTVSDAKLTAEESCRQALKTIADACDQSRLRGWRLPVRYVQEETVLRDCGQRGCAGRRQVARDTGRSGTASWCAKTRFCAANCDHLSSENASLSRQVESMAMRIESLAGGTGEARGRETARGARRAGRARGHLRRPGCARWALARRDGRVDRAGGEAERLAGGSGSPTRTSRPTSMLKYRGGLRCGSVPRGRTRRWGRFWNAWRPWPAWPPDNVHEHGWQWRPTDADTAFAPPFGTIRQMPSLRMSGGRWPNGAALRGSGA